MDIEIRAYLCNQLMYIPLSDDKHRFVRNNSKTNALEIQELVDNKNNMQNIQCASC